jgi:hypothetical protein
MYPSYTLVGDKTLFAIPPSIRPCVRLGIKTRLFEPQAAENLATWSNPTRSHVFWNRPSP